MPKLSPDVLKRVKATEPISPADLQDDDDYNDGGDDGTGSVISGGPPDANARMIEWAVYWAEQGWNVFPLKPGDKIPLIPKAHQGKAIECKGECGKDGHGAYDGTTDLSRIRRWWSRNPRANIGANLGDDRLVFDLDLEHGPVNLPFPNTRSHFTGRGGGNRHLIYRYAPGSMAEMIKGRTKKEFGASVDVRTKRGQYVVMPPSIHPDTQQPYRIDDESPDAIHVLSDPEVTEIYQAAGVALPARARGVSKGIQLVGPTPERSHLVDLLQNPPERGKGQTNDWLAQVAGHYAKRYRNERDLYEHHLREAIKKVDATYEDFEKTANSIWDTETSGHPERKASKENGFLVGRDSELLCRVKGRDGGATTIAAWADFDLTCRGVAVDEEEHVSYWVTIHRTNAPDVKTTVDAKILADSRRLATWLGRYGVSYSDPPEVFPSMSAGTRLIRYLNSQDAPKVQVMSHLGWFEGIGFVTNEGVITKEGVRTEHDAGVVADRLLAERKLASFQYGFEKTWEQAQEVLNQVLTFQDETVTSVFGAWWAACLLKPQLMARTSVFPFFGIEATSESGKTNGFFDMMVQLNGNTRGHVLPTVAAMRDMLTANSSGIVWADDLDSLDAHQELLRSATSGGTSTKFDKDSSGMVDAKIVAPVLITGESLGMNTQKALRDRVIQLEVMTPIGRRSLLGDYSQWEDVKDLQAKYPKEGGGLAVLAGWYVQAALTVAEQVEALLREHKRTGSGRRSDKFVVLTAGARVLDSLTGHPEPFTGTGPHAVRVARWVAEQQGRSELDRDNAVTLELIPWALRAFGENSVPDYGEGRFQNILTPVLVRDEGTLSDPHIYVRSDLLADAWKRENSGRINDRTETGDAIRQQLLALGSTTKVIKVDGKSTRYLELPTNYAVAILERSRG